MCVFMKVFGGSSIGRKITLCVAAIIIAAMGITGGATYQNINKNMQVTVRSNMLSIVQDKANLLSTQIGCYKKFVKSATLSGKSKIMCWQTLSEAWSLTRQMKKRKQSFLGEKSIS